VERFSRSADETLSAVHVPEVPGLDTAAHAELTWHIVPLAQRAWADIRSTGGRLPFRHDHYLKLWQLARPVIAADYLMFDEARDADPVTAAIIQNQSGVQKITAGDPCQAIYGWRGAVDALSTWPCDVRLQLTQSFRFGPGIATEANKWLGALGAPYRLAGVSEESAVGPVTDPQVIVCRTSAEAFAQARAAVDAGRKAALAGSSAADLKGPAQAALDLQAAGQTGHPQLAAFRSWGQVRDYARTDTAGADLATAMRLIDSHGGAVILGVIDALTREDTAEVVVCTVHAAKGREWERVRIGGDFPLPAGERAVPRGEAMLAYVAVTRARCARPRRARLDRPPPGSCAQEGEHHGETTSGPARCGGRAAPVRGRTRPGRVRVTDHRRRLRRLDRRLRGAPRISPGCRAARPAVANRHPARPRRSRARGGTLPAARPRRLSGYRR
jgi:hypothetical protein